MKGTPPPDPGTVARSLPIYAAETRIVEALRENQVVVLEGPTGSGKTTQIPRILLRAGYGDAGQIGITQPRRIAAVSVAHRIAVEEGVATGEEVGYAIRFDDKTGPRTRVKVMTDGILLQEVRSDPQLSRYSVIVIDEAHERSLNIDFCLGLLHRLVQQRSDLRVMVTSATMRPEEFQAFFASALDQDVPRISVEARVYPVDVHYRPPRYGGPDELIEAAAREFVGLHRRGGEGHVLTFLTGEAMIHATQQAIYQLRPGRDLAVLPLFGRLPRAEQERVFDDFGGRRKVVLATNIAETSITIPDVRYVVDCGLAKIPRFDARTGISTLREEPISRASAEQRAGRAGRTGPGQVFRLYGKDDLHRMPDFTDEEIRRLDLSEVALRLIDLGIHDVERFPFPTKPPRAKLGAAIRSLTALGAIDDRRELTPVGHRMVPFPLSPALARMVVEAAQRFPDVVEEVLTVAAFLSARPPFLFPRDDEDAARRAHAAWANPLGDPLTLLDVHRDYRRAAQPEKFCERNYLDKDILAFADKAKDQLADIARQYDVEIRGGGNPERVARCFAAGFADKMLRRSRGRVYETERGDRVGIHPGSALYGQRPQLVTAAEIVVSTRPYARQCSLVLPEWLRELRPDLAASWNLGPRGRRAKGRGADAAEMPRALDVGGVRLKVRPRGGRPHVDVPIHNVRKLLEAGTEDLDPACLRWSARVVTPYGPFASGLPLGKLLDLLPLMPLPTKQEPPVTDVPEGALLTVAENWSTLAWLLKDRLLAPALPMQGKKPGWASLVANGLGTFWFEVIRDFPSAVQSSSVSLSDLVAGLPDDHPARAWLPDVQERLAAIDARLGGRT